MAAQLIAEEGFLKGLVLSLEEGDQWIIGRDPDACQLLIEDPAASRKHVLCRKVPQGIIIENLSATNPVQVNGEELEAPRLLKQGDAVHIGSGVFRFYTDLEAHVELPEGGEQLPPPSGVPTREQEAKKEKVAQEEAERSHNTIFDEHEEDHRMLAEIDFNLAEAGRWLLKVITGPNHGAEFAMQVDTTYVIGTDPATCDIVFQDISVSRQHARITVTAQETLTIEDLNSRNGTFVDGQQIEGLADLAPNTVVAIGTTTFIIFDREGERTTVISPLLPSIVKALQREGEKPAAAPTAIPEGTPVAPSGKAPEEPGTKTFNAVAALLLVALLTGVLVIVGVGVKTLFETEEVAPPEVDVSAEIDNALRDFPSVKYSYNKATKRLLLVGHVLTSTDRTQILYNLQSLGVNIDDNIIIDELIWQETNQTLARDPAWRGISIHSPTAGHFVVSGYLQTRKEADRLSEYLTQNFGYLDLLEKRVVVVEDLIAQINQMLDDNGFHDIEATFSDGEVILKGNVISGKKQVFADLIEKIKALPGVRSVRNQVTELAAQEAIINISDRYTVTGISSSARGSNVVINGRILFVGDVLDGMVITNIQPNTIFLEKGGIKYKIDYNK